MNDFRKDLIANISHEIRTPLSSILGLSQLLTESNLKPQQQIILNILIRSSKDLLRLLNDLLDFTKLESDSIQLTSDAYNIRECLSECAQMFQIDTIEKKISLGISVDYDVPINLCGDRMRVKQILVNLISNAIKYTNPNGYITIYITGTEQDSSYIVKILVRDSGPGIRKDDANKLFKKFTHIDNDSEYIPGSGLGLFISRNLAKMMGGDIKYVKNANGSLFIAYFRNEKLVKKTEDKLFISKLFQTSIFDHRRVLIYVSDQQIRLKIIKILTSWKMHIIPCTTKEEADIYLKSYDIEIVFIVDAEKLPFETTNIPVIKIGGDDDAKSCNLPITEDSLLRALIQVFSISADMTPIRKIEDPFILQKNILIIEDDQANLFVLQELLSVAGLHNLTFVTDGKSALARIKQYKKKFHLILLDIMLPKISGIELAREIRKLYKPKLPVIIAISAISDARNIEKIESSPDIDDFIPKPINTTELLLIIEQHLLHINF